MLNKYIINSAVTLVLVMAFFLPFASAKARKPKNVIYIIADGFGFNHITAARIYKGGVGYKLNLEKFKVTGLAKTYCENCLVTDSAAAASALATGHKVSFKVISLGKDLKTPLKTIMDVAKASGKSTGVVTTDSVLGATPAAFYAHVPKRDRKFHIADQIANSGLDLLLGGGRRLLHPPTWSDYDYPNKKGSRIDSRDLVKEISEKGWNVSETGADFSKNIGSYLKSKKPLLGTFAYERLPYEQLPSDGSPRLSKLVEFAIEKLSRNKKGFVLMIESANIDVSSHVNYTTAALNDVLAMDEIIGNLLKLNDTLIVFTSDHETSGLTINGYSSSKGAVGNRFLKSKGVHKDPGTKEMISTVAWMSGPGSEIETGKKKHLGGPDNKLVKDIDYHPSFYLVNSGFHTGGEVPVFASGPGSERFSGFMENSDIPKKIASALGLKL